MSQASRTLWILSMSAVAAACGGSGHGGGAALPSIEEQTDGGSAPPALPATASLIPTDPARPAEPGATEVPGEPALPGCGLHTKYVGDEYCILPPPEGLGFQIHHGPSDYDNPDEVALYLLQAGLDSNESIPAVSGNTEDVYFYGRQYRMRPHSHHLIVSEKSGGSSILGMGRRLGGSQNAAKDNPAAGTPPESVGIGMPLAANTPLSLSLHYFNPTDGPVLKEVWVNFWYVDPAAVTQEAREMFLWAQGGTVQPGESVTVTGSRVIDTGGRILTMYGHRHSNNVRFSAYRTRGAERELVYDDYDWEEPAVLEYNSIMTNPAPSATTAGLTGGRSGILDLKVGDSVDWQCDVRNDRTFAITFGENEGATSEMCILVGDAIGPTLLGF